LRKLAAGIVHEKVECAEFIPDRFNKTVDLIRIAYGQGPTEDLRADAFQKRNRRGKFFFVAPAYGDVRAQSRQKTGDRLAETASAAGNDDRFPRKKDRRDKPWAVLSVLHRKIRSESCGLPCASSSNVFGHATVWFSPLRMGSSIPIPLNSIRHIWSAIV